MSSRKRGSRKPKKPRAPVPEKKWKLLERVVALLEGSLTPDCRVEHDVQMPELVLGNLRQCDVLVRSGRPPRETLTLVEVQDRSRKPDLDKYRGWCAKRELIGAQHLICVSAKGFSASVIADAKLRGPCVRLLTLKELEREGWPLNLALGQAVVTEYTHSVEVMDLAGSPGDAFALEAQPSIFDRTQLPRSEEAFEIEGHGRLNLPAFFSRLLDERRLPPPPPREGNHPFDYILNCPPSAIEGGIGRVWIWRGDKRFQVGRLRATGIVAVALTFVPTTVMAYEQVDLEGAVAWIARSSGQVGTDMIEVNAVFTPAEDGRLQLAHLAASGLPDSSSAVMRPLRPEDEAYFESLERTKWVSRGENAKGRAEEPSDPPPPL